MPDDNSAYLQRRCVLKQDEFEISGGMHVDWTIQHDYTPFCENLRPRFCHHQFGTGLIGGSDIPALNIAVFEKGGDSLVHVCHAFFLILNWIHHTTCDMVWSILVDVPQKKHLSFWPFNIGTTSCIALAAPGLLRGSLALQRWKRQRDSGKGLQGSHWSQGGASRFHGLRFFFNVLLPVTNQQSGCLISWSIKG